MAEMDSGILASQVEKLEVASLQLDDLPQEIILKILKFTDETTIQRLRGLSVHFKNLIDAFHGISVRVHNSNWDALSKCENVRHAVFNDWTRDFCLANSSFTSSLTELEIWSPGTVVSFYNIMPLLSACDKLKVLSFSNIVNARTLPGVAELDCWSWLNKSSHSTWYPSLERFKFFDNWESLQSSCGAFACCSQKLKLLSFLFKTFANTMIKHLEISLRNSYFWFPLKAILQWVGIEEHEIEYHKNRILFVPIQEMGVERIRQIESMSWDDGSIVMQCKFYQTEKRTMKQIDEGDTPRQIETWCRKKIVFGRWPIFIQVINQHFLRLWRNISSRQYHLREIKYEIHLEKMSDTFIHFGILFKNNASTLQKLTITLTDMCEVSASPHPITYTEEFSLSDLQTLTHFSINHFPKSRELIRHEKNALMEYIPLEGSLHSYALILDCFNLPTTLRHFELYCPIFVPIANKDFTEMFSRLIYLESLKLVVNHFRTPWIQMENGRKFATIGLNQIMNIVQAAPKLKFLMLYQAMFDCHQERTNETEDEHSKISPELAQDREIEFADGKLMITNYPRISFHQMGDSYFTTPRWYRMVQIAVRRNN